MSVGDKMIGAGLIAIMAAGVLLMVIAAVAVVMAIEGYGRDQVPAFVTTSLIVAGAVVVLGSGSVGTGWLLERRESRRVRQQLYPWQTQTRRKHA